MLDGRCYLLPETMTGIDSVPGTGAEAPAAGGYKRSVGAGGDGRARPVNEPEKRDGHRAHHGAYPRGHSSSRRGPIRTMPRLASWIIHRFGS